MVLKPPMSHMSIQARETKGLTGPPVTGLEDREKKMVILIATSAIRIQPKSFTFRVDSDSNRHKTPRPSSHRSAKVTAGHRSLVTAQVSSPLIGSTVIRIWPKSFILITGCASNRRQKWPERFTRYHRSLITGHRSRLSLLIGSPVIRIQPKPFAFSADSHSNRHKSHGRAASTFRSRCPASVDIRLAHRLTWPRSHAFRSRGTDAK
jgi:hypothetical protein